MGSAFPCSGPCSAKEELNHLKNACLCLSCFSLARNAIELRAPSLPSLYPTLKFFKVS